MTRFTEVMEKQAQAHYGEVFEFRGDGSLSIFPSAVDALACAETIQQELQTEPLLPLRIGIHLRDILKRDGKIYGNGVNIASRIESMGIAGSDLVSEQLIPYLKGHPQYQFSSLGKFEFKHVDQPLEVFALANEGIQVPKRSEVQGKFKIEEAVTSLTKG